MDNRELEEMEQGGGGARSVQLAAVSLTPVLKLNDRTKLPQILH